MGARFFFHIPSISVNFWNEQPWYEEDTRKIEKIWLVSVISRWKTFSRRWIFHEQWSSTSWNSITFLLYETAKFSPRGYSLRAKRPEIQIRKMNRRQLSSGRGKPRWPDDLNYISNKCKICTGIWFTRGREGAAWFIFSFVSGWRQLHAHYADWLRFGLIESAPTRQLLRNTQLFWFRTVSGLISSASLNNRVSSIPRTKTFLEVTKFHGARSTVELAKVPGASRLKFQDYLGIANFSAKGIDMIARTITSFLIQIRFCSELIQLSYKTNLWMYSRLRENNASRF